MKTLCGHDTYLIRDPMSGEIYGRTCSECLTVVGSVGMPKNCRELYEMDEMWRKLGGKGLDAK